MSYKGDVLIIVGVAIILLALYLGYTVYTDVQAANALQPQQQQSANINASISALTSNASSSIRTSSYYIIEVLILFLFASIGYKISLIGTKINIEDKSDGLQAQDHKQNAQQKRQ
ncbi:MAG: YdgA family protein [Candidatus Marsarchaeota archaeon]|jgi:hypothetical protein|nr:YdgA family protein [Candidatus Marsarchaeota archaeon]